MKTVRLLKDTAMQFANDNITSQCAALAYYSLFSLAPLLILSIAIGGFFFGAEASRGEIYNALQGLLGGSGAHAVEDMIRAASQDQQGGRLAAYAGIITLLFGASGAFSQLQSSLNWIWKVETAPGKGLGIFLRQRLLSFSMVLVIGFLLLISLVATAALSAIGKFLGSRLPGGEAFWHVMNMGISFALITLLFAAIFKILPDVRLRWREVLTGAAATAFLFDIGKFLIGLYLGKSSVASSYGAAGSVIIVLLWVYYSSFILLFGAEFTRTYLQTQPRHLMPKSGAQFMHQAA